MLILKPVRLARRLKAVPELGPYEIHVGALSMNHVDQTIVVRRKRNLLIGPLLREPSQSTGNPSLLVLQIGDFSTALHPSATVMVVPDDYKATVTVAPKN